MKRLITLIALFFAVSMAARAQRILAPILHGHSVSGFFVQENGGTNSSSTSTAVAFNSNVTGGNVIAVVLGQATFSNVSTAVSDTLGTGFVKIQENFSNNGLSLYAGIAPSSGADTVTATFGSAVANIVAIHEYQNVTVEVDAVNSQSTFGGSIPNPYVTNITTTTAGDLLLTDFILNGAPSIAATASGYTNRSFLVASSGVTTADAAEGSAGSQSSSWAWTSGGATSETAILAALRPSSVGASLVQTSGSCSSGTTANVQVFPAKVLSGDVAVIIYSSETTSGTPTIADTLGTSFTLQVSNAVGSSNKIWIWTGVFGSSGSDTVTVTFSGSWICHQLNQFHGLTGTVTDTGVSTSSSGSMSWSQTVSHQPSIVVGGVKAFHSSTTFTPGTGFLQTSQQSGADAMGGQFQRVSSLSTVTFAMTVSTSDSNVGASIVIH